MSVEKHVFKVGLGNVTFNVRYWGDPAKLFPDGCKIETSMGEDGRIRIYLLNRQSGMAWSQRQNPNKSMSDVWQITRKTSSPALKGLPQFGATSPESVEKVIGGLLLTLPKDLPEVHSYGKESRDKKAKKLAPPRNQHERIVVVDPAPKSVPIENLSATEKMDLSRGLLPDPREPAKVAVAATRPSGDLLAAVDTLNQWKTYLGDKLAVTLTQDGRLGVMAEYGEI